MEKERDLCWCQFTDSKGFPCCLSCFRSTNSPASLLPESSVKKILTPFQRYHDKVNNRPDESGNSRDQQLSNTGKVVTIYLKAML